MLDCFYSGVKVGWLLTMLIIDEYSRRYLGKEVQILVHFTLR
jgi:hypothetical protein